MKLLTRALTRRAVGQPGHLDQRVSRGAQAFWSVESVLREAVARSCHDVGLGSLSTRWGRVADAGIGPRSRDEGEQASVPSSLTSRYLREIWNHFNHHTRALTYLGRIEFVADLDTDQTKRLEIVNWLRWDMYAVLTLWDDRVAIYSVREAVKKRKHKVLVRVPEFSLQVAPASVFREFLKCSRQLAMLSSPPGETTADRELLDAIGARWCDLSQNPGRENPNPDR